MGWRPDVYEHATRNAPNLNFFAPINAENVTIGNENQINSKKTSNKIDNSSRSSITVKGKIKKSKKIILGIFPLLILVGSIYYFVSRPTLPPVTDIVLPPRDVTLKPSDRYEIKAAIFPKEAEKTPLSYTSEDSEIATVSRRGIVLAQGKWEGNDKSRTTRIIIQAENGVTPKQFITVEKNGKSDIIPTDDVEEFEPAYILHLSVRPAGTKGKNWTDLLEVNVGDEVEYQIEYKNTSNENQYNVMIRDMLPNNMEYIPGSTHLWNAKYTGATIDQDDIVTEKGINIGGYTPNSNAIIRLNAKVVDKDLKCGSNTLVNWGHGTVNGQVIQDYANVHLNKE